MRDTHSHARAHTPTDTLTHSPVDGCDDEGDGGEADGGCRPLAHRKWPARGFPQQEERRGTDAVDGESRNRH